MKTTISVSGTKTTDAGRIDITLSDDGCSRIIMSGTHSGDIPYNGELELLAVGKPGKNGKIGADGEDGKPGMDGRNASAGCPGGNGGQGHKGKPGDEGTDGGPAGDGGEITVTVAADDLALLDVISNMDVSAGIPGRAGKHGAGGAGGRGGRAGDSYSWSSNSPLGGMDYHNEPEGKPGRRGKNGYQHTYLLFPGAPGADGRINLRITQDQEIISTHTKPFHLITKNSSFSSAEQSNLWEPGDTITAVYTIQNTAPTLISPSAPIPIIPRVQEQLELLQTGEVPGNIVAGSQHSSDKSPVVFKIKAPEDHNSSTPYDIDVAVTVDAMNTRLDRPFAHASTTNTLRVCYPARLEPQAMHFSIALKEIQTLQATVKNISAKTLGFEAGRQLRVEIAPDSDLDSKSQAEVMNKIAFLEANQTFQIQQDVYFKPNARFGNHLHFNADLYLQPIDRSNTETLIQRQPLSVQLTPQYQATENGFLLVINSQTTEEEINYWQTLFGQLAGNPNTAIWNTSYYGAFNLDDSSKLLSDTAKGTVVILDNTFRAGAENTPQKNSDHIRQDQLLKATQGHNISLLVVGEGKTCAAYNGKEHSLNWQGLTKVHSSLDELVQQLLHEDSNTVPLLHRLDLPRQKTSGSVRVAREEASILHAQLSKVFPNRRYHVSYDPESSAAHQTKLIIRRLTDSLDGEIKQLALSDEALKNPIDNDDRIQDSLVNALAFSHKLRLFARTGNPYSRQLAKAISADLYQEQQLVLQSKGYGSICQRLIRKHQHDFNLELKKLGQLVAMLEQFAGDGDFKNVEAWSPLVINLIGQVHYHAEQQSSFWTRFIDWFLPQTREQAIKSSLLLCEKALIAQSTISHTSLDDLTIEMRKEKKRLELTRKLTIYLENNERGSSRSPVNFFNKPPLSREEVDAAEQLLRVSVNDDAVETLLKHMASLTHNKELKLFLSGFENIDPKLHEFIEAQRHSLGM